MRYISFIPLLILALGCAGTRDAVMKPNELNGTWVPVAQQLGGKALPTAAFEHQTLVMNDSAYTLTAESVDKGVVLYQDGTMDIYGKEGVNAGKHFTAIYKLDHGQLTICYNLSGDRYPESFETKGKLMYFLSVFKKN